MANVLKRDKQVAVITQLLEGSSVRSTERITGVHRDTILRLMVKVASGCAAFHDRTVRDLHCNRIEVDEIWAFVSKKNRNVTESDEWSKVGDQYTFVALDPETKLIPAYKVGKRTAFTTMQFIDDLASRITNRIQVSSDAFPAYYHALATSFGRAVDYGDCKAIRRDSKRTWALQPAAGRQHRQGRFDRFSEHGLGQHQHG